MPQLPGTFGFLEFERRTVLTLVLILGWNAQFRLPANKTAAGRPRQTLEESDRTIRPLPWTTRAFHPGGKVVIFQASLVFHEAR